MCRHIEGNCPTPNCRFPHDFSRGINRKILVKHQCENLNPVVLVKFLRIKSFPARPPGPRGPRRRGGGRRRPFGNNQGISRAAPAQKDEPDRQVDISYPISNSSNQIDMEIIEMRLNVLGIKVEDKSNDIENEYCHRGTLQLAKLTGIE